ncbi:alpha/beta hydrolase [Actinoplanes aureus]|uniref:alpha/beta hydrolase n=1 Tax=Actinoplanes aureus TaxID=2792083 RepID=UPI002815A2AC|nr:alpha/beta fold hydrolase [Actinoplanes aureus]
MRGAVAVLIALVLILILAWAVQRKLIYFPDRAAPPQAAGASEVTLRTSDGLRLGAWLIKPMPGTPDRRLAVLVAPGNAGNRYGRLPLGEALARLGLTVLLLEYRGYGGNPGSPSEQGLARDADAGLAYLVEQVRLPVLYYGESLGAAVVTALAVRQPPAGLVLRSPFEDLATAGRAHYPFLPVGWLLRDRFPVTSLISQVKVPTVVVYGTADTVVPPAQSAAVAGRAAGLVSAVVVDGADHNDRALLDGPQLIAAVAALI